MGLVWADDPREGERLRLLLLICITVATLFWLATNPDGAAIDQNRPAQRHHAEAGDTTCSHDR